VSPIESKAMTHFVIISLTNLVFIAVINYTKTHSINFARLPISSNIMILDQNLLALKLIFIASISTHFTS